MFTLENVDSQRFNSALFQRLNIMKMLILSNAAFLDTLIIDSIFAYLNVRFNRALFQRLNSIKMLIFQNAATIDTFIIDSIFA